MSTTFEVFPTKYAKTVTFGDVLEKSQSIIQDRLKLSGIDFLIYPQMEILSDEARRNINGQSVFKWAEKEYTWFSIAGNPGGTDVYCDEVYDVDGEEDPLWRLGTILDAPRHREICATTIASIKENNRVWSFRRSAGQTSLTNLSYGLLAASVAILTKGLIVSEDSAWDYERFPATGQEFITWYFNPDLAIGKGFGEWSKSCLEDIRFRAVHGGFD